MNVLISDKGVCGTSLATQGLVIIWNVYKLQSSPYILMLNIVIHCDNYANICCLSVY